MQLKYFLFLSHLELDKFCWTGDSRKPYVPVILTGDFNTTAESNVYELLSNGQSYYHGLNHCGLGLIPTELGITDSCQHYDIGKCLLNTNFVFDRKHALFMNFYVFC